MNTENSKTNESNKFIYYFTDKISLKNLNKNIAHGKTLNLHITIINLIHLFQLGMKNLIYLMDHTLFQAFLFTFVPDVYHNLDN